MQRSERDMPPTRVEVFADITCPFTHVGLERVVEHVADHPIDIIVRAWPLEWVNGAPLEFDAVQMKARVLNEQLDVHMFAGLRPDRWPTTTIPALNLAALAYARDAATGLSVSIALRDALFERGLDVADDGVLAAIADGHDLQHPERTERAGVRADYDEGLARGVNGPPHFWAGEDDFFCPALDIGHDAAGALTARFDAAGLARFFARIDD